MADLSAVRQLSAPSHAGGVVRLEPTILLLRGRRAGPSGGSCTRSVLIATPVTHETAGYRWLKGQRHPVKEYYAIPPWPWQAPRRVVPGQA